MRVALIAPPFIPVPPADYGGTELFVAHLAEGLQRTGIDVVVYTNGESSVNVERRWIYERSLWPIKSQEHAWVRQANHESWAAQDAARDCQILHVQSPQALVLSRFVAAPTVLTLHGPHDAALSELYSFFPGVHYVCISDAQGRQESMPRIRTIHHGIDVSQYCFVDRKQPYLSFIGRIAPIKGVHLAIEVAKRTGIPLKIAGDVQPTYREYFENKIKPELDGVLVEYIGVADLAVKNELLGNSMAMLFPIQWNEPFGLVMVEAMACGTPVLAMPGGSVPEVVRDGISGYVCRNVRDMAGRVQNLKIDSATARRYVEEKFSIDRMVKDYVALYENAMQISNSERVT
jgi:glycosyltransferase involved in cell wall biosynthesis